MWLSSTAQNALRAVLHIAARPDGQPVRADDIARDLDLPRNYLSKTLHALARAGVLRSTRGPRGGFQLEVPAAALTLHQVIAPFAPSGERRCLLGRARCGDDAQCLVHHRWSAVASGVEEFFHDTTIADLITPSPRIHLARALAPDQPQEPSHARPARRTSRR